MTSLQRESTKLAYGADNPYARTAEYDTVAAITREDLLQWHKRTIAPANMILGIAGDFDSAAMEQKLRQAFANMPKGERFVPAKITFNRLRTREFILSRKMTLTRAT